MPFLLDTLRSIKAQTYRNWQVLVWDNGSTDGTVEVLREWVPVQLPGIVYTGEPLPVGLARARLVALANTEWVAIVDGDDVNLPQRLAYQVNHMTRNPELDVLGSWSFIINDVSDLQPRLIHTKADHHEILYDTLFSGGCQMVQPSTMLRRRAVLDVGNYQWSEAWNGCNIEDWDLWLRMFARGCRFGNLQVPLLKYREHDRSTTSLAVKDNRLQGATDRCFYSHLADLLGLSTADYVALKTANASFALPVVLRLARHLQARSIVNLQPLRSPRFLRSVRCVVKKTDYITRAVLALLTLALGPARTAPVRLPDYNGPQPPDSHRQDGR